MPSNPTDQPRRWHGFELYPFQAQAFDSVDAGHSVLVSAPTGAGKTVVAEYAMELCLSRGERVIYTSPVKALSNQKFRDFRATWGDRIGIMTGDVTINAQAPALIMTTEIFRNTLITGNERNLGARWVIMDEIHYIADSDRGTVWEECLMFAPKGVRFLGLSATISNLQQFRDWICSVREEDVDLVITRDRPVPLQHHVFTPQTGPIRPGEARRQIEKPVRDRHRGARRGEHGTDLLDWVAQNHMLPGLFFCFSRRECEMRAQSACKRHLVDAEQRRQLLDAFDALCRLFKIEDDSATPDMRALAAHGVLYHHAGMLPVWKEIVERLFTTGALRMLFTTETFALGVNMPARSVCFSSLRKFNGIEFDWLTPLQYHQMAGRAGRQGMDTEGSVFANIDPERDDPKAVKDVIFGKVPPLTSQFNLPYNAVLRLWHDVGEGIYDAVGKSFAAWLRGDKGKSGRATLRSRLKVLERAHYLEGRTLTGKGRLATRLQAFEISITELHAAGCFEDLTPGECAMLLCAVVHEARRGEMHSRFASRTLDTAANRARKRCMEFAKLERAAGIENCIKPPDFSMTAAMAAWVDGSTFDDLHQFTAAQAGDIVRTFRMTVQVLRDFAEGVPDDSGLRDRLRAAVNLVNRAEVDAEALLLLSARMQEPAAQTQPPKPPNEPHGTR
ncbi:MAG: DEAD/DEAH box helicase [Planctomycetes bacterium]|nr:DEAD/DEAH box helicase [Planctomycetota bacterium]